MTPKTRARFIFSAAALFLVFTSMLLINPIRSLRSFRLVEGFPIYSMTYYGNLYDYLRFTVPQSDQELEKYNALPPGTMREHQACTVFSATGGQEMIFGRNRDLSDKNKALLLFSNPPGGYRSISIVDLNQMGLVLEDDQERLPIWQRFWLLAAPLLPTEGMNEFGLTIAKADVPSESMKPFDPAKDSRFFRTAMREVLDHAKTTEEAVALLDQYNIAFGASGGHFLIADASGNSVIVEYFDNQVHVIPSPEPWQVMTNFCVGQLAEGELPSCDRYLTADNSLEASKGKINPKQAMEILESTSVPTTLWSVVFNMGELQVDIALYREFDNLLQVTDEDW